MLVRALTSGERQSLTGPQVPLMGGSVFPQPVSLLQAASSVFCGCVKAFLWDLTGRELSL